MTTRELIQTELDQLDESTLQQIYTFIKTIQPNPAPSTAPPAGLLSKLRQIQIEAPADFTQTLDTAMTEAIHGHTHLH